MIGHWNVPYLLTTAAGSIALSEGTGYKFDPSKCDAGADLRVTKNNVPNEDGSILGRVLAEGYAMRLFMWLMNEAGDDCAGGAELLAMLDDLGVHLWALRDPDSGGRIEWTPPGAADDRMLDQIKIVERGKVVYLPEIVEVSFAVATRFPYAMDRNEIVTNIASGGGASLNNLGTAEFWPVFKVYGATSSFTLSNQSTGLDIVFDASLPGGVAVGGGSYVEIDTFRNTAYINGNQANAKPSIDMELSDFWSLYPGPNAIAITGASVDILWQAAWD